MVLEGGFAVWNEINIAALQRSRHLLTDDARAALDTYDVMRTGSLAARLTTFAKSRMRRQTLLGNFALLAAVLLRKV
jgi:hypothetical protein